MIILILPRDLCELLIHPEKTGIIIKQRIRNFKFVQQLLLHCRILCCKIHKLIDKQRLIPFSRDHYHHEIDHHKACEHAPHPHIFRVHDDVHYYQ